MPTIKKIAVLCIAFSCAVFILLSYYFYRRYKIKKIMRARRKEWFAAFMPPQEEATKLSIGILSPLITERVIHIKEGLEATLMQITKTPFDITVTSSDNDRLELFNKAKELLASCNCIISCGYAAGEILTKAAEQLDDPNKLLCHAGIEYAPEKLVPKEKELPPRLLFITKHDQAERIQIIKTIKPSASSIVIIYRNHNEETQREIIDLSKACQNNGMKAIPYLLSDNAHIEHQLETIKESFDTIILMPRTAPAKTIESLKLYVKQRNITLCSFDHDSVAIGVAIGIGGEMKDIGKSIGSFAHSYLVKKQRPAKSIIECPVTYRGLLNTITYEKQAITLPPHLYYLLLHTRKRTVNDVESSQNQLSAIPRSLLTIKGRKHV